MLCGRHTERGNDMIEFFKALRERLKKPESFVLTSIVASSGSTPRGNGAKMAVFEDGSTMGTIGGGNVEYLSTKEALRVLKEKCSMTKGFNLTKNQTADIGMICGGNVVVYFQYINGGDANFTAMLDHMLRLYDADTDAWLVTAIKEGAACQTGVYDKMSGLNFMDGVTEAQLLPFLKNTSIRTGTEPDYFVEPLIQSGWVYVFGGGHVAQELVPVIAHVGFKVVVYEDREHFADPRLFKGVHHTVYGDFKDFTDQIQIKAQDYVVIMTRGHQSDYEVLYQALQTPAAYIGVIGSRHKIAATTKRLLEAGIAMEDINRMHTPIGLPIKGETPAEIAISIAAEMILIRSEHKERL